MRIIRLAIAFVCVATAACGDDSPEGPDPRVIAGGGIGDGPIDGVVNLYVVDDTTNMPISGATVRVGDVDGMTDETGLFVAKGVTGPQTVIAKAAGFRTDMWVGANGANMTMHLEPANLAIPDRANVTATIAGWDQVTVAATHLKVAIVFYSQTDDLGDPANELETANGTNVCATPANGTVCSVTVTTRTGQVGLLAVLLDVDTKGTQDSTDDTTEFLGYAHKPGITVTPGQDQTGVQMTILPATAYQVVTADFGTPPPNLNGRAAIVGIDVGADGVFQLPFFRTPADRMLAVPKLDALGASGYRLTGIAADGDPATQQSIVLRRDLTGTTLSAGSWLVPPASATASRIDASWSAVDGATLHAFELASGSTRVVNVTVFDGTTEITLPDLVTVPSGTLRANVNAIGAPGLDVTNFSLEEDVKKLAQVAQRIITIP